LPDDAITAWIGPAGGYRDGSLYVAGGAQEGQLAFKLDYSNVFIVLGLARNLLTALPPAVATGALFLLPGLALLLLLASGPAGWQRPVGRWDKSLLLIVSAGLSAAMFPLLLLFSRLLGLRWGSGLTWLFLLLCLGLVLWRLSRLATNGLFQVRWSGWRELLRRPAPETWLLWLMAALVLGVRWFVVRPLSVPMWGDSLQHTYIAQLMVEHGGLFDSWEPYSPHASFTVHFGFHASVAFFHWVTGIEVLRAVVLVGQILNGLAVLTLYPLAVRIGRNFGKRGANGRWAGVVAVLVAGLLTPMPMEYVNWGRYPQLAGQMILPVALWLLWLTADHRGRGGWKRATLAAVAAAGMTLTYYRMPYYYAVFVLAWLLFYCLVEWRLDRSRWLALVKRMVVVGAILLVLILPWGTNIAGGRLAASLEQGVSATPSLERIRADYAFWRDIEQYVPPCLCLLFLLALAWSLLRRYWRATMLGLWTVLLASLVAAQLIHLPGASHMQSFAILIALYLPVGLMVGWFVGSLVKVIMGRWKVWGMVGGIVVLLIVGLLGFRKRMAVVDPAYALVNRADEVAMDWIRANTPPEATFLVNGFLIYQGYSAVGSDAGWWIPFLAGRKNTMPPQYALFNEAEVQPGYGQAVVQLVTDLSETPPTTPAGLEKLCQFGVTHVYVGQGQGRVATIALTPYLVPDNLVASADFDLVYHQDRVWIFALKDGVCR
jgi:hypothetical protein